MTATCPICRSAVPVEESRAPDGGSAEGEGGIRLTCPLCEEVFLWQPAAPGQEAVSVPEVPLPPAVESPEFTSTGSGGSGSGSAAIRRLLSEEASDGQTPRVLIAHDSHAFCEVARGLLEEEGFDVDVAHDGLAAAQALEKHPPAVAVLEAGLPHRFGLQVVADFRKAPAHGPTRFLVVASIYDRKRLVRGAEPAEGVPDDFVEPRNIELELLPKVKKLLRKDGTASRAAASAASAPAVPVGPAEPGTGLSAPDPGPAEEGFDFGELFQDGSVSASTGPSASRSMQTSLPEVDPLATPRSATELSPLGEDPVDRLLAEEPAFPTSAPAPPPEPAPPRDEEKEIWEKVLAEEPKGKDEGDELLRSLMEMAGQSSAPPDDPVSEPSRPVRPPAKDESLDVLAELAGEPASISATPKSAGPLEESSSLPDAWKADEAEKAIPTDESDREALESILRDAGELSSGPKPAAPPRKEDVVTASDLLEDDKPSMELGPLVEGGESFPPGQKTGSTEGGSDEDPAVLLEGFASKSGSEGVVPSQAGSSIPTVLKDKQVDKDPLDEVLGDPSEDEKSLPEAEAVPAIDPLDEILGSEAGPRTKPGVPPGDIATDLVKKPDRPAAGRPERGGKAPQDEHEKARRLAKLIVGDILLYNADRIADAVKSGNFFEVMKGDIKDGRDFYDEKVPDSVRSERDYIQEVLEEVLVAKRKELGLS